MSSGPGPDRRAKWEAFWQSPRSNARATHLRSAELALELLRQEGQRKRRLRVLDLGCGDGEIMQLLTTAGLSVVGIDLAAAALHAARQRLGRSARLIQGDAFRLPLDSETFDAVVSLGYASVGSYPGAQHELARILRPGGVALVDFRHLGLYHLPLLLRRGRRLLRAWRRGQVSCALLGLRPSPDWAAAGLRLETVRCFNTYPPLPALLSPATCLAFERSLGRRLAPVLGRVSLARFRKAVPASCATLSSGAMAAVPER